MTKNQPSIPVSALTDVRSRRFWRLLGLAHGACAIALVLTTLPAGCGATRPAPAPGERPAADVCVAAGQWVVPGKPGVVPAPELLERAARGRVVLLGEEHDRAEHHRWQLQTIAALHALHPDMLLGFEAFPRRVQPVLDRWVAGEIDEKTFLTESGWDDVWGIDAQLYLPIFHLARMNRVPMRALNVDRATVARVAAQGWTSVAPADREGLSNPAPPSPGYEKLLRAAFDAHERTGEGADDKAFRGFVDGQLAWDRAFAEGIAAALRERPQALVVGVIGTGHLEHGHGVPHQFEALGVSGVSVLLPWNVSNDCESLVAGYADAVFGIEALEVEGAAKRPLLGVAIGPAAEGVAVLDVVAGSTAEKTGIRKGDVIVEAAGTKMTTPGDLRRIVERHAPGTWLPLRILRAGKTVELVARFPAEP